MVGILLLHGPQRKIAQTDFLGALPATSKDSPILVASDCYGKALSVKVSADDMKTQVQSSQGAWDASNLGPEDALMPCDPSL